MRTGELLLDRGDRQWELDFFILQKTLQLWKPWQAKDLELIFPKQVAIWRVPQQRQNQSPDAFPNLTELFNGQ